MRRTVLENFCEWLDGTTWLRRDLHRLEPDGAIETLTADEVLTVAAKYADDQVSFFYQYPRALQERILGRWALLRGEERRALAAWINQSIQAGQLED